MFRTTKYELENEMSTIRKMNLNLEDEVEGLH